MRIVLLAISAFFFGAVVLAAVGAFLVVSGAPDTCSDRDLAPVSAAAAEELNQRWEQFSMEIGRTASAIEISEIEATSRGRQYLEDQDVPVEDVRVYFCGDGDGQLAGKIGALGIDADFVVTGRLDVSGPQPVVQLESVDVGSLPGFVSDAVLDLLLDDDARTLELDENLVDSEIVDGLIIISGGP